MSAISGETRSRALVRTCDRLRARIERLNARSSRLSWLRLIVFVGGLLAAFFTASVDTALATLVLVAALVVFVAIVLYHRHVRLGLLRYRLLLEIKQTHLARQSLDWTQIPRPLSHTPSPEHPFEIDLDITGERSIHHLLDTAVTVGGSTRLRGWLLSRVPDAGQIAHRQALVRELLRQSTFRDKLSLYGRLSARGGERWSSESLDQWLAAPVPQDRLGLSIVALALLAALNIALLLLNAAGLLPYSPVPLLLYIALSLANGRYFIGLFQEAALLHNTFARMQDVFGFLERRRFPSGSLLYERCQAVQGANRPSRLLRRLNTIVAASSLQNNIFLWAFLNLLVPWDLFFAYQLRRAKQQLQAQLPAWLDTWYDLEALSSLATFAYLNPTYPFPRIETGQVAWRAESLGHPLIPAERRVTNDFSLDQLGEMALVTGSNMSGKSTFLRTVGVNMALAYAGSVVVARQFDLSLFRIFTCIRITDSLADGFSYFYAEVRRLRALLDAFETQHDLPLFFLIDEIFRGTNNRERFIGSLAYLRALTGEADAPKHGMGIVSTHDLELTRLAGERVRNYHFADRVEDGRMVFDYRLYSGPSSTTNALRIMAMEGLPVDSGAE